MSGIAAAAIMAGATVAGSVGSGLLSKGAAGGAAGGSDRAAREASMANIHQAEVNRSDSSPWTNSGLNALQSIGGLLGWGTMTNPGTNGSTYAFDGSNAGADQARASAAYRAYLQAIGSPTAPDGPQFNYLNVPGSFEADPGYQFRYDQGMRALDRTAASKGMLLSGAQIKGAQEFNSGLASQEYANWWNRYSSGTAQNNQTKQQEYADKIQKYGLESEQGQNYLRLLMGVSGQGQGATQGTAGTNSALTSGSGNFLTQAGMYGGNANMAGTNALASGIGSGINNAITAYGLYGGGSSSYGPEANVSGFTRGQGPTGPSGAF